MSAHTQKPHLSPSGADAAPPDMEKTIALEVRRQINNELRYITRASRVLYNIY